MFAQIKKFVSVLSGSDRVQEHPIIARRKPSAAPQASAKIAEPVRIIQAPAAGAARAVKDLQEFLERNLPVLR